MNKREQLEQLTLAHKRRLLKNKVDKLCKLRNAVRQLEEELRNEAPLLYMGLTAIDSIVYKARRN